MNINLNKYEIALILDALEGYQLDIEHGKNNGYEYKWAEKTEDDVENLAKYLNGMLDKCNE